ncbi:MAG: hypothetical protein FWG80_03700 [Alphaproteobacteria bacterium]|nr:hypothetical protein [Alphaproteobacteria bacterium]
MAKIILTGWQKVLLAVLTFLVGIHKTNDGKASFESCTNAGYDSYFTFSYWCPGASSCSGGLVLIDGVTSGCCVNNTGIICPNGPICDGNVLTCTTAGTGCASFNSGCIDSTCYVSVNSTCHKCPTSVIDGIERQGLTSTVFASIGDCYISYSGSDDPGNFQNICQWS